MPKLTFITDNARKAQTFTDRLYSWGYWPVHFSRTYKSTGITRYYIKAVFTPFEADAAKQYFTSIN